MSGCCLGGQDIGGKEASQAQNPRGAQALSLSFPSSCPAVSAPLGGGLIRSMGGDKDYSIIFWALLRRSAGGDVVPVLTTASSWVEIYSTHRWVSRRESRSLASAVPESPVGFHWVPDSSYHIDGLVANYCHCNKNRNAQSGPVFRAQDTSSCKCYKARQRVIALWTCQLCTNFPKAQESSIYRCEN